MNDKNEIKAPNKAESMTTLAPRIYVSSLADYVCGILHGRWIDAAQDVECIRGEIDDMLKSSTQPIAEEWAIHDYEGFGPVRISEYEDIEKVARVATLIEEHGDVFAALLNHLGGLDCVDDATSTMEDGYCGAFETLDDYVQELYEDVYSDVLGQLPDILRYNIDWESIARDAEISGEVFSVRVKYRLHVFRGDV